MEQATVEASNMFLHGGIWAGAGAIIIKIIDKIPFGLLIGRRPDKAVKTTEVELMIAKHEKECRICLDERFRDTIDEFKAWRQEDVEWRREDIKERREFRKEMIDSINRLHLRLDGKADK